MTRLVGWLVENYERKVPSFDIYKKIYLEPDLGNGANWNKSFLVKILAELE